MQRRTAIMALLGAPLAFRQGLRAAIPLRKTDDEFLEDLSRRAFQYFCDQANPETGLILDRSRANGGRGGGSSMNVASVAATGFGLTALAIGAERKWIREREAMERARTTLRFLFNGAPNERGWFYHFMDASTGQRSWKCEISSIDTALLLAGILTVREKLRDPEISWLSG